MAREVFIISLTTTPVILLLLLFSPITDKYFSAKWRYYVWLVLALRLVIPVRAELSSAPINFNMQDKVIYFEHSGGEQGSPEHITEAYPRESSGDKKTTDGSSSAYKAAPPYKDNKSPFYLTFFELLNIIWAAVAALMLLRHIIAYVSAKRKIIRSSRIADDNTYICSCILSPIMLGFFKPTIVFPDKEYTDEEKAFIPRHEMTHFKRCDARFKLLLLAAGAMHWFNPVIYVMVNRANRDIEYACDSDVTRHMDKEEKKRYSMTLLKAIPVKPEGGKENERNN